MSATDTTDPTVYQDPYPDKKGNDLVWKECAAACKDGVYGGFSRHTWTLTKNGQNQTKPWCRRCKGKGGYNVKVASVRTAARKAADTAKRDRDLAPYRAWLDAEARHNELLADEEAAYAEQAQREARKTGYVGEVGEKLTALEGEITTAYSFETPAFGYGVDIKMILIITLDSGEVVKWASTGSAAFGYYTDKTKSEFYSWKTGDRVRVDRAIVKKHAVYQKTGQEQTELKSVKLTHLVAE